MSNPTLTGQAATLYLGAWAMSATNDRRGLNARQLQRDALAAAHRSTGALRRLALAATAVSVRHRSVQFSPRRTATPRGRRGRSLVSLSRRKDERPRLGIGGG